MMVLLFAYVMVERADAHSIAATRLTMSVLLLRTFRGLVMAASERRGPSDTVEHASKRRYAGWRVSRRSSSIVRMSCEPCVEEMPDWCGAVQRAASGRG